MMQFLQDEATMCIWEALMEFFNITAASTGQIH
jgi:hypothetical protein